MISYASKWSCILQRSCSFGAASSRIRGQLRLHHMQTWRRSPKGARMSPSVCVAEGLREGLPLLLGARTCHRQQAQRGSFEQPSLRSRREIESGATAGGDTPGLRAEGRQVTGGGARGPLQEEDGAVGGKRALACSTGYQRSRSECIQA